MVIAEMATIEICAGQVWAHKRTQRKLRVIASEDLVFSRCEYIDTNEAVVISDRLIVSEFELVSVPRGGLAVAG